MFIVSKIKQSKNIPFGITFKDHGKKLLNEIDHFLLSNSLINNVKSININKKPRSKKNHLITRQSN